MDRPSREAGSHSKQPRRVIVVFPDLTELLPVIAYRRRWDPLADHIAPHLTLVFPFVDGLSPADLHDHIVLAADGVQPFNFRLSGVSGSEGENIFLNVKTGNDPLIALHDALYTGPLQRHLSRLHTYVPHATIGRVADQVGFATALEEAVSLAIDAEVLARQLSVYTIEPDGSRHIEAEGHTRRVTLEERGRAYLECRDMHSRSRAGQLQLRILRSSTFASSKRSWTGPTSSRLVFRSGVGASSPSRTARGRCRRGFSASAPVTDPGSAHR